MSAWQLIPYVSSSGRNPVQEYLEELSGEDTARAEVALDLLAEYGTRLGMPHVRPVTEGLWELRIRGRTQHRVMYVAFSGRRILLLHAFAKKTEQTPRRAIRVALDRLRDYQERVDI